MKVGPPPKYRQGTNEKCCGGCGSFARIDDRGYCLMFRRKGGQPWPVGVAKVCSKWWRRFR